MMRNRNIRLWISVFALAGFIFLASGDSVYAYRGDYSKQGPNCTTEKKAEMDKVISSGDYLSWQKLMEGRGRVSEVINEKNFSKFAEAYRLAKDGKIKEAEAIRKELGLRTTNSLGIGSGKGFGRMRGEQTR